MCDARINLFRNFAFTRISLFTVIGYYLFTRVRSPAAVVLNIFVWYSSSLCFSEWERQQEMRDSKRWERVSYAVRPNKVLFSTFHKIKRFGNVYKPDKIETVLSPEILYTTKWDEWWVFSIKNWIHNKCMFIWLPLSFTILLLAKEHPHLFGYILICSSFCRN